MAYTINRFNGTVLTSVEDGTVDQTTDLKLIGKNYSGYGEAQNENFLFMLENFAGSSAPTKPISGMLWFDNTNNKIKVYDGAKWKPTGGAEVSATTPTGLSEGDLWWNSTSDQLYGLTDANDWILIGPQKAGSGTTEMQSLTLYDSDSNSHAVIAAIIEDEIVFVINYDNDFIPLANTGQTEVSAAIKENQDLPSVFPKIKKGITLAGADGTTGVTTSNGVNDDVLWGTSADALRLAGIPAANYLTIDDLDFTAQTSAAKFGDEGFTLGDGDDLTFDIENGENPTFSLATNVLRVRDSSDNLVWTFTNTGLNPGANNSYSIGTSSLKLANIYATAFTGQATAADTLAVSGTNRSASTSATANSIAARDASGNLTAGVFNGTATKARYADLAEKYTVGEGIEHAVGTVMMVGRDECCEMEPFQLQGAVAGVISEAPAYLMNSECEGQAIALKGRVPVRVVFPIEKGQKVYAWSDGTASSIPTDQLVGIALETNKSQDEKLVEVFLKV